MTNILKPADTLIEQVAGELAATWYEIGRSQGLKSKHKNALDYARANLEKFIPKALEHLIDMLNNPTVPIEQKEMIHDCIVARANDPKARTVTDILNDVDAKKLVKMTADPIAQLLKPKRETPITVLNNTACRNNSTKGA